MIKAPQNLREFKSLVEVVKALRGPGGCPWDKEQTPYTLTPYAIEEVFELVEAIESGDQHDVVEELGDVMLQVVLHAQIAGEEKRFTLTDVIEHVCEKLVRRHPHVFADLDVKDSEEVLKNWDKIKYEEKKNKGKEAKKFSIPVDLPALQRSGKIGRKSKKFNFDWPDANAVFEKVEEEFNELKEALAHESIDRQKEEIGDLIFSLAQLTRHLDGEPEQVLRETNTRFEGRFFKMIELAAKENKKLTDYQSSDLEALWKRAKKSV